VVRVWVGHYQVLIFIIPTREIWGLGFQPLTNACICIMLQRAILISGSSTNDGLPIGLTSNTSFLPASAYITNQEFGSLHLGTNNTTRLSISPDGTIEGLGNDFIRTDPDVFAKETRS
jgi:hypothetical protein